MWCVLLTMHHTPARAAMYRDVASYYQRQGVPLYVVDSGNHGIDPGVVPLHRQVVFDQRDRPGAAGCASSTDWEMLSLREFVESPLFARMEHRHVFKLTAKYKLPGLRATLDAAVSSASAPARDARPCPFLVVQRRHYAPGGFQNSEIVGFERARMPEALALLRRAPHENMEHRLHRLLRHPCAAGSVRLAPLINQAAYRRGNGSHLPWL